MWTIMSTAATTVLLPEPSIGSFELDKLWDRYHAIQLCSDCVYAATCALREHGSELSSPRAASRGS